MIGKSYEFRKREHHGLHFSINYIKPFVFLPLVANSKFIIKDPFMATYFLRLVFSCMVGCFFLSGCSSIDYKEGEYPRMLVSEDHTPLFQNGPAQGNGPDLFLSKGDEVSVMRREFGYSVVRTSDGGKGYVDNESLVKAPPEPISPTQPKGKQESPETFNPPAEIPGFRY